MAEEPQTLDDLKDLGAVQPPPPTEEPEKQEPKIDAQGRSYATGKRKDAIARVWIKPGTGQLTVNGRTAEVYFARPVLRMILAQPYQVTERFGEYDTICTVSGGGLSGQAGAVRHGISKALALNFNTAGRHCRLLPFQQPLARVVKRQKMQC